MHFDGLEESKPDLGLDYLDYVLLHPKTRDCLFTLPLDQIRPLHMALDKWKVQSFDDYYYRELVQTYSLRDIAVIIKSIW